MLEKNRHKRPNLETVLKMDWFASFKEIAKERREVEGKSKFLAFTLT